MELWIIWSWKLPTKLELHSSKLGGCSRCFSLSGECNLKLLYFPLGVGCVILQVSSNYLRVLPVIMTIDKTEIDSVLGRTDALEKNLFLRPVRAPRSGDFIRSV